MQGTITSDPSGDIAQIGDSKNTANPGLRRTTYMPHSEETTTTKMAAQVNGEAPSSAFLSVRLSSLPLHQPDHPPAQS
jgi:hypothetical protein